MKRFLAFTVLVLLGTGQSFAADRHELFIEKTAARMDALRAGPKSAWRGGCIALFRQAFEVNALAGAIAREHWPALGTILRNALKDAVSQRLATECTDILGKPYPGPPVIRRTSAVGQATKVTVEHVDGNGKQSVVIWRLIPGGQLGMRALDVAADGRGLVAMLRGDFEGALAANNGSIKAAIDALAAGR